ncbi:MAG: tRNA uridine-5-carboxymethylaminomethyl(34) synthesis GTPase MnmE [Candidatus Shikimatogenerans bostrichidophilus]|nr:MAG: tRNA uridine-5-carboxymethylaminomethyl(34) synthesis GTPase MnmE [Candidatus Shikimatogenerans bostrichidophilus]
MDNFYLRINKTITAISTPLGIGAISIIRISGNKSIKIIKNIFIKKNKKKIKKINPNIVNYGFINYKNEIIDQVIIIFFKKPKSYTGENLIEIYCHGSIYIQKKIINLIIKNGANLAKNGEFSFRAFLNKKINLLQAESILDLINSKNKIYHKIAINNLINSKISNIILKIQNVILDILSFIEIKLDFLEENINIKNKYILNKIKYVEKKLKILIKSFKINKFINNGFFVSIIGPVNSGKSTLMNVLINENKSIVTNIPGTTRDIVEGKKIINNFKFYFFDTAGLRKTKSYIENIGIKKTLKKILESNIIFYVFDILLLKKKKYIYKIIKFLKKIKIKKKNILLIANKIDINNINFKKKKINNYNIIFISAKKKIGINNILNYLNKKIPNKIIKKNILINNIRHFEELKKSLKYIKKFKKNFLNKVPFEFIYIDLKYSIKYLNNINGNNINNNDILNNIFSKFCIGK